MGWSVIYVRGPRALFSDVLNCGIGGSCIWAAGAAVGYVSPCVPMYVGPIGYMPPVDALCDEGMADGGNVAARDGRSIGKGCRSTVHSGSW